MCIEGKDVDQSGFAGSEGVCEGVVVVVVAVVVSDVSVTEDREGSAEDEEVD